MAGICSSLEVVYTREGVVAQKALEGYASNQLDDLTQSAHVTDQSIMQMTYTCSYMTTRLSCLY